VNNVGTGTSITINKPTGVVAGDVMIAHFELEATSAFPTSTGWTTYTSTTFLAVGGTRRTALLYRVAGSAPFTPATEPSSYTFTVTGTNTKPIEGACNFFLASPGATGAGSAPMGGSKDWAGILIALRPGTCQSTCTVTLTGQGGNQTVEGCPATYSPSFTAPTASDSCGYTPTITSSDSTSGNNCTKAFTRTWTATDACGSTATTSQTFTVHDTTAPGISTLPDPSTIECPAS